MTDLAQKIRKIKPVKGQHLASWLNRFFVATPDQLASWKGTFTEVTTAKVVEIYRKRGCIEEYEVNQKRYGSLQNAIYRSPLKKAESLIAVKDDNCIVLSQISQRRVGPRRPPIQRRTN